MRLKALLPVLLLLLASGPLYAQQTGAGQSDQRAGVDEAVNAYLEGLRTNNPDPIRRAFHPSARIVTVRRDGTVGVRTLDEFLTFFRNDEKQDRVTDSRILMVDIHETQAVAKVWMRMGPNEYTDILTLLKTGAEWKIINKSWTGRRAGN